MTKTPKSVERFLAAVFIALVFGPPLGQYALDVSNGEIPFIVEILAAPPTVQNLRLFEDGLEDRSWITTEVRPLAQYVLYHVLRDPGEKTLRGPDNWLFYKPDVSYLVQPWPDPPATGFESTDAFRAIASFRDQLKARGIQLLVVPVPVRPRVYAEDLGATCSRSHAEDFIEALEGAGIATANLFRVFDAAKNASPSSRSLYLTQDTHWSHDGIKLAAHTVAERLLELGWVSRGTTQYELRTTTASRQGDLWRMINVPQLASRVPPEEVVCEQVIDPATGSGYVPVSNADVLVIGDSFIGVFDSDEPYSAGFASHLSHARSQPVASMGKSGGAATLVRQELARRPEFLDGAKVVVWEFIERDLRFGIEGWKEVKLPPPNPPDNP